MKNGKKIIVTLATAIFLSTSIGQAQGIAKTTKTRIYNPKDNRYTYCINSNINLSKYYKDIMMKLAPILDKDFNDTKNNCNNGNTNQNNNQNNNQDKPETPVNEEPQKPEIPKEPEQKPEKPQQPEKPTNPSPKPSNPEPEKPTNPSPKPSNPEPEKPNTPVEEPNNSNSSQSSSVEKEVARLVNLERQKAGLAPLTFSEEISKVARLKSQDMADKNYFSHTSPTYGDPFQMMRSFGIKFGYAGENIAKGYRSPEAVMNGWMNSSGHRANILNSNFKKIGVGYIQANGTTYWTQMFTD